MLAARKNSKINLKLTKKPISSSMGFLLLAAGLGVASSAYASKTLSPTTLPSVPSMTGYFPIEIQNNIGPGAKQTGSVKDVYILFTGEQPTGKNPQCLMSLAPYQMTGYNAWVATCTNVSMTTKVADYAQAMSKLQPNSNPVLIYIPQVISGRTFISLNYPLDIPMTRAADGTPSIQAPSLSNTNDGNYYLIYDKFEYTYDLKDTFWIDVTSVDDFGLPIGISYTTDPSTNTTIYGGYIDANHPNGQSRDDVIVGVKNFMALNGNSDWMSLVEGDDSQGYNAITRIDAPNTSPSFNPNYLTAPAGFNYLNTLINYYSNAANTLTVDASEVDSSKYPEYTTLNPSGTDPNAYLFDGIITDGKWIFSNVKHANDPSNDMTLSLNLNQATSGDFFGPGQSPFDTPNGTVRSVIVKYLTAAFSAGLLPLAYPGNLSETYFETAKSSSDYYQINTILNKSYNAYKQQPTGVGPWYDLYAQAVHNTAKSPVYAFAFDDVLKQDGTFSIPNKIPDQTAGTPEQPVLITFGSVGDLHVPLPGPNYQKYPAANDVSVVSNVQQTGFSCSATGSCTLSASWTNPNAQSSAVKYLITAAGIPNSTVLASEALINQTQTSQTVNFTDTSAPNQISYVMVYSCIPSDDTVAAGYDCPSELNKYTFGNLVPGAQSPITGVNLVPVQIITNPGFTCGSSSCSVSASWKIPAGEPVGTKFYILPNMNDLSQYVPISDVLGSTGQTFTTGTSSTLTLPFVQNSQQVMVSPVTKTAMSIQIMACIDDTAAGKSCPSSPNYVQATSAGSNPQPAS